MNFLPIVFTSNIIYDEYGGRAWGVTHSHVNKATNTEIIFPVVHISEVRTEEEIKSTIRHEIIHYLLGIQYKCHEDSSALFWLICDCFSGDAYLPMNENSQKIYDVAKPYINAIFELYRATKREGVAINISLMLMQIDNAEAGQTQDLQELEKCLKICEEAAHIERHS